MATFVLCFVLIAVAKGSEDNEPNNVACTGETAKERNHAIEKAKCGEPKNQFVFLEHHLAHEQVSPEAVWLKRCVGNCDFDDGGDNCVPTGSTIRNLSVRIFNAMTNKEACATFPVEEHVSCGCGARRLYNPRDSTCPCPNMEERRSASRMFVWSSMS